jgi:carboxylesterase
VLPSTSTSLVGPDLILLVALAGAALVWVWRARHLRAMREIARCRRLAANGVVIGGGGFVLERPRGPAVLLLHGGGDTPQTLRYLGTALYGRGFHVCAPLLPGHGRSIADFQRVSAEALTHAARKSYDELRATHDWVAVMGISMGGALAVQLAAQTPEMPALGLIAPYLALPPGVARAASLSRVWGVFAPVIRSANGTSILDPNEREHNLAYGVFTAAALRALRTTVHRAVADLPKVVAPTLVIHSREDNRITVADAERAFALLGAKEKRLEWVSGAAHIITVDYGRERVIAALTSWAESHRLS